MDFSMEDLYLLLTEKLYEWLKELVLLLPNLVLSIVFLLAGLWR